MNVDMIKNEDSIPEEKLQEIGRLVSELAKAVAGASAWIECAVRVDLRTYSVYVFPMREDSPEEGTVN